MYKRALVIFLSKYFFKHMPANISYKAQPFSLFDRKRRGRKGGINFSRELIPGTIDRYKVYHEMHLRKYCVATCKVSASAET